MSIFDYYNSILSSLVKFYQNFAHFYVTVKAKGGDSLLFLLFISS